MNPPTFQVGSGEMGHIAKSIPSAHLISRLDYAPSLDFFCESISNIMAPRSSILGTGQDSETPKNRAFQSEQLLPAVYDELRRLAANRMGREMSGQTLQATALVHEAWLRLSKDGDQKWENRGHFFSAAAESMRRILIENARKKSAQKRGGRVEKVALDGIEEPTEASEELILMVHDSLDALGQEDQRAADLVKLRFFAGLTVDEAALALGVTNRTATRDWRFARVWLYKEIRRQLEF